jgi:hypothetical protein
MGLALEIAYIGNFGPRWNTEEDVASGFERLGHTVTRMPVSEHDHDSIAATVKDLRPDLLIGAKWQFRGADGAWPGAANHVAALVEDCRPFVGASVCWHWDLVNKEFSPDRFAWQKIVSAAVDLTCLTDGSVLTSFPDAMVIRDGCPDDIDDSVPFAPTRDVLFLGTAYGDRPRLIAALRARFGSRFTHVESGVTGPDLTKLIRDHRLVVGPHWPFFPGYASDRSMIVRSHGGLLVAPEVPGYGDGLMASEHFLPVPVDVDTIIKETANYLMWPRDRLEAVRMAGHAHALARPWTVRCSELLSHLKMS